MSRELNRIQLDTIFKMIEDKSRRPLKFWTLSCGQDCCPLLTERGDGMVAIVEGDGKEPVWVTKEQLLVAASLVRDDERDMVRSGSFGCVWP